MILSKGLPDELSLPVCERGDTLYTFFTFKISSLFHLAAGILQQLLHNLLSYRMQRKGIPDERIGTDGGGVA